MIKSTPQRFMHDNNIPENIQVVVFVVIDTPI